MIMIRRKRKVLTWWLKQLRSFTVRDMTHLKLKMKINFHFLQQRPGKEKWKSNWRKRLRKLRKREKKNSNTFRSQARKLLIMPRRIYLSENWMLKRLKRKISFQDISCTRSSRLKENKLRPKKKLIWPFILTRLSKLPKRLPEQSKVMPKKNLKRARRKKRNLIPFTRRTKKMTSSESNWREI